VSGGPAPRIVVPPPGPRSRELSARLSRVECPAFDARRSARAEASGTEQGPIVYARGEGATLFDVDGNAYVDLTCGFGALPLGHAPPEVTQAVQQQLGTLHLALGDVYASDAKVALCERIASLFPEHQARVMLGLSGADAITAALKTSVLATGRAGVVAFEGSYHGLSYAPLAACGLSEGFRAPFAAQLGTHVRFLPFPRAEFELAACKMHVTRALASGGVGCVLVEPMLGRGGCIAPPPAFLPMLREACDAVGALLVCDEIWTGLGRSGAMLASAESGVVPDVVCLGKALGGGLPISACVARGRVMAAWGAHGGATLHTATHFGSPLACVAAMATLEVIDRLKLAGRAYETGARWMAALREQCGTGRGVIAVRGRGLMVGIELDGGAARALAVTRRLLEHGYIVLTGGAAGDVLTLTPPLDVDEEILTAFARALPTVL
jgi:4-aminobutyrate aminotransferase / (S)-3-amino-2-methylpropionate transaminase / 5-aminovalerate transaminase